MFVKLIVSLALSVLLSFSVFADQKKKEKEDYKPKQVMCEAPKPERRDRLDMIVTAGYTDYNWSYDDLYGEAVKMRGFNIGARGLYNIPYKVWAFGPFVPIVGGTLSYMRASGESFDPSITPSPRITDTISTFYAQIHAGAKFKGQWPGAGHFYAFVNLGTGFDGKVKVGNIDTEKMKSDYFYGFTSGFSFGFRKRHAGGAEVAHNWHKYKITSGNTTGSTETHLNFTYTYFLLD